MIVGHATPIVDKDNFAQPWQFDICQPCADGTLEHGQQREYNQDIPGEKHGIECEDDISDDNSVSQGQVLPSHWCNTHNLPHDINYKKYLCQQRAAKQQMQSWTSVTEISCSRGVTWLDLWSPDIYWSTLAIRTFIYEIVFMLLNSFSWSKKLWL